MHTSIVNEEAEDVYAVQLGGDVDACMRSCEQGDQARAFEGDVFVG